MNDIERAAEVTADHCRCWQNMGRACCWCNDDSEGEGDEGICPRPQPSCSGNPHAPVVERAVAVAEARLGPHALYVDVAEALADAGLLLSDADRAVLDAADAWERADMKSWEAYAPTVDALIVAVRARRETQP